MIGFVCMINFEQILPYDRFGIMMLQNLKARNLELPGIHAFPTLDSQKERFLSACFDHADAVDMKELFDFYISDAEKKR